MNGTCLVSHNTNYTLRDNMVSQEDKNEAWMSRPYKKYSNSSNDNLSTDSNLDEEDDDSQVIRLNPIRPCLRWKDSSFQSQTMEALNQMRKNRHFCDVTLQIGQQDIPAHRVVLAAASPYLMELFAREDIGFRPSRKEVFELDGGIFYEMNGGFQKEALERLVDYAYTAQLEIPGDEVKAVYMASLRLRMDRVTSECARFLLSQLDLASCLDLRSMPGVAPELFAIQDMDKDRKMSKEDQNSATGKDESGTDVEKNNGKKIDLMDRIDDFIESNLDQLSETRQLRALPRINLEVLHLSKQERDAALHPRPLCELALDWTRNQWLEDDSLTLERLAKKRHLLYMPSDGSNTLKDCRTIRQGSINDSDVVEDYRKQKNQFGSPQTSGMKKRPRKLNSSGNVKNTLNSGNTLNGSSDNRPSKPRELLYSRHINQNDHAKQVEANESGWKVIACRRLGASGTGEDSGVETSITKQGILAVVSIDRNLATFSIVQRVNQPSTPPRMVNSISANDLGKALANGNNLTISHDDVDGNEGKINGAHPAYSPSKTSREGSINGEDLVYASIEAMSQGKCGVGAEIYEGKLIVCGGYDRGECLSAVEMFDFETNSWSSMKPMITKRGRFGVAKVIKNGAETLYAVAGSSGQMEESSVEKFDAHGNWTNIANLPVAMSYIGVCSLDDRVYCIGGTYGPSGTKYCFRLNETESKWDRIANLQQGRFQAAVASFEGRIWVVGGCDAWNPLRTVEIYDPSDNSWSSGPPLSTPRRGCGLAVRKGHLVVVGGSDGSHSLCTTEVLDVKENVWKPGPTMTTCRANVAVAVVDDRVWAVGGFSGKVFLNSIEQLDPLSDEWTTFLTMPEKLITPSKSFPVNVIHTDRLETERKDEMTDLEHDKLELTSPKLRENEDGILFEMDFDSVENRNASHENTDPTKDISSSFQKEEILRESICHTQKSPAESNQNIDNDQSANEMAEPISKHVLSTDLDNFSPSKTCASCDKTNNTDDNSKETSTRENNDGTEV